MSYVSSGSYKINAKLRSGEELSEYEKRIVDGLDTALQKMPKYEGTVYRSLDSSMIENLEDFWRLHTPDKIVTYDAFTSSAVSVYDKQMDIQMVIKSKNGRDIRNYNPKESEILFGRNSIFQVTDVKNGVIYLEEV